MSRGCGVQITVLIPYLRRTIVRGGGYVRASKQKGGVVNNYSFFT